MMAQQQLGSYIITRQLGRGGFATVYLGRHIHLGTLAAVKILNGEYEQEEELEAFRQEARTIAELRHRNIIRVLDFGIENFGIEEGKAFLILEFAPFGSLRTQYGSNIIPLPAILSYVQQVASALTYAQRYNIIHRDIKPENMLIDAEQKILISDFGMAQLISSSMRTNSGPIGGTAAYIAPEQLQGKPNKQSDQYALAVTVYEWLTGSWPFQGAPLEIISQHLNTPPPPLRSFIPNIASEIEEVVLRGLEKDPMQRFPTVIAFARALRQAAGIEPRRSEEEQFHPLLQKKGTMEQQKSERSKKTREFASVKTVRQIPPPSKATMSSASFPISRRAVLAGGGLAALVLGIGGIVAATHRGNVQTVAGVSHTATPTPKPTPLTMPTATPKPTAAATPTPKPTAPPEPTQPPPTATPIPQPAAGTLYLTLQHPATTYSVAWSPDGTRIATGGADKLVRIWNTNDGTLLTSYPHAMSVTYVAWSPNGTMIASASDDGTVRVFNPSHNSSIVVYTGGQAGNVHSVTWSPDGTQLASGGIDKIVRIWDLRGNTLATYTGHTTSVWGVAWSPDGTRIASGSGDSKAATQDNTIQIWKVGTSSALTYAGHTSTVFYVSWSPDSTRIASGSDDETVQVWDAKAGNTIQTYYSHTNTVYGVAWSPDGTRIASGSTDNTVVIWSTQPEIGAYSYTGHTGFVFGVAWSPDSTRIASGSADNTVQIWQA